MLLWEEYRAANCPDQPCFFARWKRSRGAPTITSKSPGTGIPRPTVSSATAAMRPLPINMPSAHRRYGKWTPED